MRACEPEPFSTSRSHFFASPESSRQKYPNVDIMPFYGLNYMRSTSVLQSTNMAEYSHLNGKFSFHLIFST